MNLFQESRYIREAPAYDVAAARRYFPVLPAIRAMVNSLPPENGKDTLTLFGARSPSGEALERLSAEIGKLSAGRHRVSLILADLEARAGFSWRSDLRMCAQSTIKAVYCGALVEAAPEALNENGRLLRDAIVLSDNESYERLRRIYGPEPIRRWCADAGVDPAFAVPDYPRDRTAREMLRMWTRMYRFLNQDTTGFAAYYADSLASATRKQLTLPLQSKAGWENGLGEERCFDISEIPMEYRDGNPMNDECAINDTGIVYTAHGPYIFVIYTDHPYAAAEGCPNPLDDLVKVMYEADLSLF